MGDGYLNKCKECAKDDVRKHRESNLHRIRAYDRKRSKTPKRKQHIAKTVKAWRAANPDRYKAQSAVGNAIRDGRLARPNKCEQCGMEVKLHGHHDDYGKPLEVMWLCPPCHSQRHKELSND